MITFAELLRKERQSKGLTLDELADKIGRSGSSVSNWERGRSCPSWTTVWKVEDALGFSQGYFMRRLFREIARHWPGEIVLADRSQVLVTKKDGS